MSTLSPQQGMLDGQGAVAGEGTSAIVAVGITIACSGLILLVLRAMGAGEPWVDVAAVPGLIIHLTQDWVERRQLGRASLKRVAAPVRGEFVAARTGAHWILSTVYYAALLVILGQVVGFVVGLMRPDRSTVQGLLILSTAVIVFWLGWHLGRAATRHHLRVLVGALWLGAILSHLFDFVVLGPQRFIDFFGQPYTFGTFLGMVIVSGIFWSVVGLIAFAIGRAVGRKKAPDAAAANIAQSPDAVSSARVTHDAAMQPAMSSPAPVAEPVMAGQAGPSAPSASVADPAPAADQAAAATRPANVEPRLFSPDRQQVWDGRGRRPVSPDGAFYWDGDSWVKL